MLAGFFRSNRDRQLASSGIPFLVVEPCVRNFGRSGRIPSGFQQAGGEGDGEHREGQSRALFHDNATWLAPRSKFVGLGEEISNPRRFPLGRLRWIEPLVYLIHFVLIEKTGHDKIKFGRIFSH